MVRSRAPFFAVLAELGYENRLFRLFLQLKVFLPDDWREDKIVWLAEGLEP